MTQPRSDAPRARLVAVAVLLTAAMAVPAAQKPSLGEVARKEADRRKSLEAAPKVYTNEDLPPSARVAPPLPPGEPPAAAEAPPPAAGPAPQPDVTPPAAVKNEAWWRERMAAAHEALRRSQVFAEALQSRINALSRDFVNRDNPVQRARIGEERAEALEELARVKGDIARAQQQIEDIQEEARRAGVPPGWLR